MNDLDNINPQENRDPEQALTDGELKIYLDAIHSAYPSPKTDIKTEVMKRINEEKSAKTSVRKKINFKKAFIKYASVAACAVIVCLVGIKVLPEVADDRMKLDITAEAENNGIYLPQSSDKDNAENFDAVNPTTDDEAYDKNHDYSSVLDVSENEMSPEVAAPEGAASDGTNTDDYFPYESTESQSSLTEQFEADLREALLASTDELDSEYDATSLEIEKLAVICGYDNDSFYELYNNIAEEYRTNYPDISLPMYYIGE